MNFQFLRRGITARPAQHLKARSSLVRRLVQAHDDPGKQRIRAWLSALDDEQLSNLGLRLRRRTKNSVYGSCPMH